MQAGSGQSYDYSGETTEWEDILIKKGIRTKDEVLLEKGLNPLDYIKNEEVEEEVQEESLEARLDRLDDDELDELEDEEFADTRTLEVYRQKRVEEMKKSAALNRFGEVRDIIKDDWIREVTEASNGSSVLVHLYSDSLVDCQLMDEALRNIAGRFKYLKCLRIHFRNAVENWPEKNLPTLFIYSQGQLKCQVITLKQLRGLSTKPKDLEWFLVKNGIITTSELDHDPREDEEEDEEGGGRKNGARGVIYSSSRFNKKYDDEDDEEL